MDTGRKRGGICAVHAADDVVGNKDNVRSRFDAGPERQKVRRRKAVIGAVVYGNARVRVGVVAVAGKVFQHASHAALTHRLHHGAHVLRRLCRVPAKAPFVDEILRVRAYVAHRRKIHVDTEFFKKRAFFQRIFPHRVKAARLVQLLRRSKGRVAESRISADTVDGPALFIHTHQHRQRGGSLTGPDHFRRLHGCFFLKIFPEQDIAAQMVFRSLLRRALFRAANDEHLAHLFRKRHFCKDRIHRVSLPEQRLLPPGILRSAARRTGSALHGRAARLCHRAPHIPQYAAARCRAQRDQQQRNAAARGKAALFPPVHRPPSFCPP